MGYVIFKYVIWVNESRSHHSYIYYSDDICNLACWRPF